MPFIWSPADRTRRQGREGRGTYRLCAAILLAGVVGLLVCSHSLAADTSNPQIIKIATLPHPQAAGLAWSGDGKYLASAGLGPLANSAATQRANPHVAIWDISAGKLLAAYRRPGPYTYVSLIGAAPLVLSSYQTAPDWNMGVAFSLWDPRTGDLIRHIAGLTPAEEPRAVQNNQPHTYSYNHSRGLFALTRGRDKTIYVYDASSWAISSRIAVPQDPLHLALSPDGRKIAFNEHRDIVVVDIESGATAQRFRPFRTIIGGIAWAPDSRRLALIISGALKEQDGDALPGEGAQIKIWDTETGAFLYAYQGDFGGGALFPDVLSWSADGQYIATMTADRRIRLWDARGTGLLAQVNSNLRDAGGIRFSPAESLLAAAGLDSLNIYRIE